MAGGVKVKAKGSYAKTIDMLRRSTSPGKYSALSKIGEEGVTRLAAATPVDTGKTAESWTYTTERHRSVARLNFNNTNVQNGNNIAILLQCGHGTGTGGYYPGTDYINPVVQPLYDEATDIVWKEVTK